MFSKNMDIFPKITVITPSYNQAEFLERTIKSVIDENYPNLEYIIIDGGSTDGSVEIIRKYEKYLSYWVSEKDHGQSHAINKGLRMATGDWIAWQNSDDIYYPGAFSAVAKAVQTHPDVELIIGDMNLINEHDEVIRTFLYANVNFRELAAEGMILSNQVAFWKKTVQNKVGFLDETLHFGFDYDWFLRLTKITPAFSTNKLLGAFRIQPDAKTQVNKTENLHAHMVVRERHGAKMNGIKSKLYKFKRMLKLLKRWEFKYVIEKIVNERKN
jgi:glycosyltransferase involved in cell wall biosynthesis